MERIVLRHLSGSKSQQVEEIPLERAQDIVFGRDPSSTVRYDPERDDLVGRLHARLTQDPADRFRFSIADLNSRNGTYVNRQRLVGPVSINPGDVIQFGPGGPELQFDIEPLPAALVKATRIASAPDAGVPSTRLAATVEASSVPVPPPHAGGAAAQSGSVGKQTVERMVSRARQDSKRSLLITAAGIAAALVLVIGLGAWQWGRLGQAMQVQEQKLSAAEAERPLTPPEIATANTESTVLIEMAWKLVYTPTGEQLYHEYFVETDSRGRAVRGSQPVPVYVRTADGHIEPSITTERGQFSQNQSIGSQGTGSGFVVTSDGFILTNRHVAAPWETSYGFPGGGGLMVALDTKRATRLEQAPRNWVPTTARVLGRRPVTGKIVEGRLDYLDVTFARNKLRMPAKLARISDRHDVTMIKVDAPQPVRKVEIIDSYDSVQPGAAITVMGYPAISPDVSVLTRSLDNFNREAQVRTVPDPTVTPGSVGRVIRGEVRPAGGAEYDYWSEWGDAYQLTVNATGPGNSGGPVFDDRGRVMGIYSAGRRDQMGTLVSFAVPIRFGMELMSIGPVLR